MSPHHPHRRPHTVAAARSGFSLVELMVVIAIIALLAALLLPAIGAVRSRANLAKVSVDIKALETGIATFKTEFGSEPPSRIALYEAGDTWSVGSRSKIRKLWPQFDFSIDRDINGNGTLDTIPIELNGAECLVFFLGGVCATSDSSGTVLRDAAGNSNGMGVPAQWTPLGFSKNPRNPFERSGGTRVGPMTELDAARFVDIFGDTSDLPNDSDTTPDGMPELLDPLPSQSRPYLYASSYEGKGYDVSATPAMSDLYGSGMASVYLQKVGATPAGSVPWNKNGYQIISPGNDAEYGLGGEYTVEENYIIQNMPVGRIYERDNITNFSSGPLND